MRKAEGGRRPTQGKAAEPDRGALVAASCPHWLQKAAQIWDSSPRLRLSEGALVTEDWCKSPSHRSPARLKNVEARSQIPDESCLAPSNQVVITASGRLLKTRLAPRRSREEGHPDEEVEEQVEEQQVGLHDPHEPILQHIDATQGGARGAHARPPQGQGKAAAGAPQFECRRRTARDAQAPTQAIPEGFTPVKP